MPGGNPLTSTNPSVGAYGLVTYPGLPGTGFPYGKSPCWTWPSPGLGDGKVTSLCAGVASGSGVGLTVGAGVGEPAFFGGTGGLAGWFPDVHAARLIAAANPAIAAIFVNMLLMWWNV